MSFTFWKTAILCAALVGSACAAADAEPPIWESNYGIPLGLTDDSTADFTFGALDFSFRFEGVTYSGSSLISISSNGFVSIGGSNGSECCGGDVQLFSSDPFGRIAAFWADLRPGASGDVYLNTFDDFGGPEKDRLVITWNTILYDNAQPILVQAQLMRNGVIVLGWNGMDLTGFDDNTLVGVSSGGGAGLPASTDLSAAMPFDSEDEGIIYELFTGAPPPFDLDQTNVVFTPTPRASYHVTSQLCAPKVWETDYGTRLGQSDDSDNAFNFGNLNFTFPFNGVTYSNNAILGIDSNGLIVLGGLVLDSCCQGSVAGLLGSEFPRIAPLWTDLTPRSDTYMKLISDPGFPGTSRVVITWESFFYDSGRPATVQAQLHTDGTIVFGYECLDLEGHFEDTLAGISPGNGAADPGNRDFTANARVDSGSQSTIYEIFSGTPPPIDLSGKNVAFTPNGAGGYRVSFDPCEPTIWERKIYSVLSLTDDSTYDVPFSAFNFSFPFAGTTYSGSSILSISSNGFVSLGGDNGPGCCDGLPNLLLSDAYPKLAPLWIDLNPSVGGQITIGQFNDWGGPETDRLVITWETFFYGTNRRLATQLQMLSNGTIVFGYRCLDGTAESRYTLIGISPGGGAADPGSTDLSAAMPFSSGSEPTIYEWIAGSVDPGTIYDVAQTNIVFEPNGEGGFHVSREESGRGTVNGAHGAITDVLRVNGSAGSPLSRVVDVAENSPIAVSLGAAPDGPASSARYVLWVWAGSGSHPTELRSSGQRLGCLVNPSPLNGGTPQPIECLMSPGMPSAVCRNVSVRNGPHFAPFTVTQAAGFSHPIRLTLQGVLRDAGAANSLGYSATNAIVINVP
ncbi:MAG: hypothetical protein HY292_05165 [Planctomycetes bacterium]|nr:hypothetical protein [Planctomycetota bacterium]